MFLGKQRKQQLLFHFLGLVERERCEIWGSREREDEANGPVGFSGLRGRFFKAIRLFTG